MTLMALDVAIPAIAREQAEMSDATVYSKTANRSVLGTIPSSRGTVHHLLDLLETLIGWARRLGDFLS
jgi:hypothetical protein